MLSNQLININNVYKLPLLGLALAVVTSPLLAREISVRLQKENNIPPPTIDTNDDGVPDAWDRHKDGRPDAWDEDGDNVPDKFDNDG